ncbi:hypothetical protein PINS_up004315 [Pythium insidiosum]|nr:hypothetical protein PINS_up004315 [Pythium insidiosum]
MRLSGLRRGVTIKNGHVWASEDELMKLDGVLEVYTGKRGTPVSPSPVLLKHTQPQDDSSAGDVTIQVSVIHVPQKFLETERFWMAITFKEHESRPYLQHLHPVSGRSCPDWNGRVVKHKMKTAVDRIRDCKLEFQPHKKLIVFGIRRKVGQPTDFTFPESYKVGDAKSWIIEWNHGDAGEYFELKVELVADVSP